MLDKAIEVVQARVKELMANGITLQSRRATDGRLEIPVSSTLMFAMTFTLPELREMGVDVRVMTPEGHELTDDELIAATLQAQPKTQSATAEE